MTKKNIFVLISIVLIFAAPPIEGAQKSFARSFIFTAAGDYGNSADTIAVLDRISRSKSRFNLALGDFSYGKIKSESAWCEFVRSHLEEDLPFEIIGGNHEEAANNMLIDDYIRGFPDRLGAVGDYGREYYFDYPEKKPLARFIFISPVLEYSAGIVFSYERGSAHYAWLSRAIDEARAAGIRWIIVGMHKNYISAGVKSCGMDEDAFNLLVEKKVDLILQGHDHNYQRSNALGHCPDCPQIKAGTYVPACVSGRGRKGVYRKGEGPIVMIIGTGGRSIYPVNRLDSEAPYFAKLIGDRDNPTFGFGRFVVSRDRVTGKFVTTRKGYVSPLFTDEFQIVD